MRKTFLSIAITSAIAVVPLASLAQTSGNTAGKGGSQSAAPDPAAPAGSMEQRYGRSPRCDSMSASDKEQCLRDEAAKTQGSQADDKAPQSGAGAGSTSPDKSATDPTDAEAPKPSSDASPSSSGSTGAGTR